MNCAKRGRTRRSLLGNTEHYRSDAASAGALHSTWRSVSGLQLLLLARESSAGKQTLRGPLHEHDHEHEPNHKYEAGDKT